ncbi:hypothetical protein Cni_G29043 [Canna indica]|uniref:Uncharacterized protein n=1 Tax=Canna indica TaxID=4628 RepID=A0AAQ3L454_9LILI|nr:hypothetical protein Cni_G29043 [Canna indica]
MVENVQFPSRTYNEKVLIVYFQTSHVIHEFRNWEAAWAMESMRFVALEIRLLAEKTDRELSSSGKIPEKLQGAGSFLMKVFGVLAV